MRRTDRPRGFIRSGLVLWFGLACAASSLAATPQGRWEGEVAIPGAPVQIVLDLSPSGAGWAGSVTWPGRGIKGARIDSLSVGADGRVEANVAGAFGGPPLEQPTTLTLQPASDGRLEGVFRQAGHEAAVSLWRSGDAQVDAPPRQTPVPAGLAGVWRGRYELGGYPREVTLTLSASRELPSAQAPAGQLLIIGKRRNELVVDRVDAGERFVTLEASAAGLRLEGQWDARAGRFEGMVIQGPFEAALSLQRDARSGS